MLTSILQTPFKTGFSMNRKVFGFIRKQGAYFPLMCSIAGYTKSDHDYEKLLDSGLWTDEVLRFGKFHGHDFRSDGWDGYHRRESGSGFASHVEAKLILWYSCHLLSKSIGKVLPIKKQVAFLPRLCNMNNNYEAEVLISRPACSNCEAFRVLMEEGKYIFHLSASND